MERTARLLDGLGWSSGLRGTSLPSLETTGRPPTKSWSGLSSSSAGLGPTSSSSSTGRPRTSWTGTPRAMAWHIADTDSRYYLASLGVDPPPRAPDLREEMERSAQHVRRVLPSLRRDLRVERRGQVWTTTKVLRRLAWHARVEVDVVRDLLAKAWTARREG